MGWNDSGGGRGRGRGLRFHPVEARRKTKLFTFFCLFVCFVKRGAAHCDDLFVA